MKTTGAIFEEQAVRGEPGDRATDDVCAKHPDGSYTIDGKPITFPVVVSDASMLMNVFLVDANVAPPGGV
jgi:hypothetical protein